MQNTVEREIKSYSEVASKYGSEGPIVTSEKLKLVVKSAIKEEDRCRNLIVFGLREATRIRKKSTDSTSIRPVKVVLPNSTPAHQVLQRAEFLKQIKARKTVFISPDCSADERGQRRNLVTEISRLIREHPNRYHFNRAGGVQIVDKT